MCFFPTQQHFETPPRALPATPGHPDFTVTASKQLSQVLISSLAAIKSQGYLLTLLSFTKSAARVIGHKGFKALKLFQGSLSLPGTYLYQVQYQLFKPPARNSSLEYCTYISKDFQELKQSQDRKVELAVHKTYILSRTIIYFSLAVFSPN